MNTKIDSSNTITMLHKLKDAIRAVNKLPNCRVTSIRYNYEYTAIASDPDWEQCKDVYAKIPFCHWLEKKYKFDEDKLFKVGDVQMRYSAGFCRSLQIEVDGKWHTMTSNLQKAPFAVKFCCKEI